MSDTESERQAIEREHHAINANLGRLEETPEPAAVHALLDDLRELLRGHFAREEAAEGLHASVSQQAPNLMPAIDELRQEHRLIQNKVDDLCHQSHQLAEIQAALDTGTTDLVQQLRDHEAREDDIFGHSVYDELGVGD